MNKNELKYIKIKKTAIFIADSHIKNYNEDFDELLHLEGRQIFLLGDIFHLCVGSVPSSIRINQKIFDVIIKIAKHNEVYLFEGNHDFGLSHIKDKLENITLITRENQPLYATYEGKKCMMAHGDVFVNKRFHIYIYCLTSRIMLNTFKLLDILSFGKIYTYIHKIISSQHIKQWKGNRQKFAIDRIKKYKLYCDKNHLEIPHMIIEGHFHMGESLEKDGIVYVSLPCFYFDKTLNDKVTQINK